MIDGLKPYPEYKDSGSPWLGKVPKDWNLRRTKNVLRERSDKGFPGEALLAATQTKGVVRKEQYENRTVLALKDLHLLKLVRAGDFVISLRSFQGGIEYAREQGIISPAYTVLYPIDGSAHGFLAWLFKSKPYIENLSLYVTGIRQGQTIDYQRLGRSELILPPCDEQSAIVRFLNHANRKIERYIRAKKKLIVLLNEQKQAIIHRAVTRGLDPNGCLKTSQSRWFPDIPDGCNVVTLRRVIHAAIDGPHFSPRYLDSGIPFLSARNVKADRWSLDDAKFISESDYAEFSKRVRPQVGDVLYTKGGTTGIARAVDLTFPFQVWVHIAVLKLKRDKVDPEYLALVLNSPRCYEQSQLFTRGATNQDLGLGRMKNIEFPLPFSVSGQRKLVKDIRQAVSAQDSAISRNEHEIGLIREYRTRLVADVVTGQLDVRETAARLPVEPKALEPVDEAEHVEAVPGDDETDSDVDEVGDSSRIG